MFYLLVLTVLFPRQIFDTTSETVRSMRRTAKKIDPLVSSPRFLFPLLFWQTSLISAPSSCVFSLKELLSLSLSLSLLDPQAF